MKLGIIGAGKNSLFHLEAAKYLGFNAQVLLYKNNRKRAEQVAGAFDISFVYSDIRKFKEIEVDAYVISSTADSLFHIYKELWELDKPMLVEKPLTRQIKTLSTVPKNIESKTIVGLNRRHYASTQRFKNFVIGNPIGSFSFHVPENSWGQNWKNKDFLENLYENMVHSVDLMLYVFGLKNDDIKYFQVNHSNRTVSSILLGIRNASIQGSYLSTFGSPSNYVLEYFTERAKITMNPLEHFRMFDQIELIEPSEDFPIRRYLPKSSTEFKIDIEDSKFKPGFVRQLSHLYELTTNGNIPKESARIQDLRESLEILNRIEREIS